MKEIGYVMSGCSQRIIPFVVKEDEKAFVNKYYFIPHPTKSSKDRFIPVLIRVFKVMPYNPEMSCGQPGPVAGKKGEPARYGKHLEYEIAWAEALGYFDDKEWSYLECSPETWDPVFEPDEEEIKRFFEESILNTSAQPHMVQIGYHKGLKVPFFLDLNAIARGHLFVAGMTRSGKSSFVMNLIRKSMELDPQPNFVIFDRRGEYHPLMKYGAVVIPYYKFLDKASILLGSFVALKLGFDSKTSAGKTIIEAIERLRDEKREINRESLLDELQEVAHFAIARGRESVLERIRWAVKTKGDFLDEKMDKFDIVAMASVTPIVIIDFSVDANLDRQLVVVKRIINDLVNHAINRKEEGDFATILVMEEVQYYAPERGLSIEVGNPDRIGVDKQLVEAVSQAGGYNVGFIILSQRPAYVLKSVISQCNTIACFRVMSGNDQDSILKYTEYGNERLREYLPCLADHEALIWGVASPVAFPTIVKIDVQDYPRKAVVSAKTAWERMKSRKAGNEDSASMGRAGFEPATSWAQARNPNQAGRPTL